MHARTGLPVVGMVGAGQLARMTHQAAIALGQSLRVLAASADDAAALVARDVVVGDHTRYADLAGFAAGCDVLTFDHEHVPAEHIWALTAAGHTVHPGADALRYAQDKRAMRERLSALGLPVPAWTPVDTAADLVTFAEKVGWPVVVKAVRGGYDGHGVWPVSSPEQAELLIESGVPLIAERFVPLRRELAALVARSPYGQGVAWPVVQTVQRDGICVEVLAPAPGLDVDLAEAAERLALTVAGELGVVGVLAVELFETDTGLLVNELAMRPHNSGHWTIEGSRTSQFEQHLRAVLDYPLGVPTMTAPAVATANVFGAAAGPPEPDGPEPVGGRVDSAGRVDLAGRVAGREAVGGSAGLDERLHHLAARWPAVKVHLYGKAARPGRKIGHVTALGGDPDRVRTDAAAAARYLSEGVLG
jgi:5-(carboxyamino)imidazole ribonucleotide synthase